MRPFATKPFRLSLRRSKHGDRGDATKLGTVQHPVLVVNGDDDVMVPSFNSFELARRLPNAQLSIFPDAGHGGIFQHHATLRSAGTRLPAAINSLPRVRHHGLGLGARTRGGRLWSDLRSSER